jgi:hypothetical protein
MARSRPWLRLDANFMTNPLVRIAGCAAVYPWVLAVLKQTSNEAADIDLDPRICAIDLGLPLDIVTAQIAAMKKHGLIICGEDGNWRDPAWDEHQIDPRPMNSARVSGRPSANRPPSNPGHQPGFPEPLAGDSGATQPIPVDTRVTRARLDRDIDIGQKTETRDKDDPPPRAARIQPFASTHASGARPASPGGKWWERMGEEHGLGVIQAYQNGADGKPLEPRRWTFGGLKIALQRLWPNEPVLQGNGPGFAPISRFITELCEEPAEWIDRLLEAVAPHGVLLTPERLNRPYDLKYELARLKNGGRPGSRAGNRSAPPARDDLVTAALAAERARLATVPDELWDLAQTMATAGEATDDEELRALIVGEYRRRNVAIPPVFRGPKAGAA